MSRHDSHISDESLVLAVNGELPRRQAIRVRAHLASCWECRVRMGKFERAIADFVDAGHEGFDHALPPVAGPRALLKARLSQLARTPQPNRWQRSRTGMIFRGLAYGFAVALLLVGGGRILYQQIGDRSVDRRQEESAVLEVVPNPRLTPGSTRPVRLSELCSAERDEVPTGMPDTVRKQVFHEYGLASAPPTDYELDYLITPGLGGSNDIRNLWPEPRYNTVWNSYVKDQLEDRLHRMVCGGQLGLAVAQEDIASNWISAYKKYFHTDTPLTSYSASIQASSPASGFTLLGGMPSSTGN